MSNGRQYQPQAHKPVSNYIVDLASLSPGEMQIECLSFELHIDDAGVIDFQSPSVRAQPGFYFVMNQIIAGVANPASENLNAVIHRISFNVLNEGRNKSVFKNPINFATMIDGLGQKTPMNFGPNVGFRFFDAADVIVEWNADLNLWPIDVASRFYVKLMGFNVRGLLLPEELRREYEG